MARLQGESSRFPLLFSLIVIVVAIAVVVAIYFLYGDRLGLTGAGGGHATPTPRAMVAREVPSRW